MHKLAAGLISPFVLFVFCLPGLAQSTITSPPGYVTADGNSTCFYFGRYADGRFQMADGELRGRVMTMSQVDLRLDNRNHTTATATGRSWRRVSLEMSDTDVENMSLTWDDNNLSTPTRVFEGRMTWPTVSGQPASTPWGHVAFPFTGIWIYTGRKDMLADYQFSGGTLANAAAWTGSNTAYYYLDGISNPDAISGTGTYMPTSSNTCNDSAMTATTGAYTYGVATSFHVYYTSYIYRDKLRLYWYSYYTAPDKPVVHVLGLGGGNPAGLDIGARCHRLYVDGSKPYLLMTRTTDTSGRGFSGTDQILIPYQKAWQGLKFHVQGAWTDSSSGLFSLTRARSFEVPAYPTAALKKRTLFHYNPASSTGLGPYSTYAALALPRITYR